MSPEKLPAPTIQEAIVEQGDMLWNVLQKVGVNPTLQTEVTWKRGDRKEAFPLSSDEWRSLPIGAKVKVENGKISVENPGYSSKPVEKEAYTPGKTNFSQEELDKDRADQELSEKEGDYEFDKEEIKKEIVMNELSLIIKIETEDMEKLNFSKEHIEVMKESLSSAQATEFRATERLLTERHAEGLDQMRKELFPILIKDNEFKNLRTSSPEEFKARLDDVAQEILMVVKKYEKQYLASLQGEIGNVAKGSNEERGEVNDFGMDEVDYGKAAEAAITTWNETEKQNERIAQEVGKEYGKEIAEIHFINTRLLRYPEYVKARMERARDKEITLFEPINKQKLINQITIEYKFVKEWDGKLANRKRSPEEKEKDEKIQKVANEVITEYFGPFIKANREYFRKLLDNTTITTKEIDLNFTKKIQAWQKKNPLSEELMDKWDQELFGDIYDVSIQEELVVMANMNYQLIKVAQVKLPLLAELLLIGGIGR